MVKGAGRRPANINKSEWQQFLEVFKAADVGSTLGVAEDVLYPKSSRNKWKRCQSKNSGWWSGSSSSEDGGQKQQRGWWSEAAAASILSRKVHEVCNNIRKSTVKAPFITPASKITSRRTSTTSLDSEMKQLGRKSPLKVTEDELPPVVQCYFELGVKRRDWQSHCNHASRSSASGSFRR